MRFRHSTQYRAVVLILVRASLYIGALTPPVLGLFHLTPPIQPPRLTDRETARLCRCGGCGMGPCGLAS